MSLTASIITLVFILACVLLVIFLRHRNKAAEKKFAQILFDHASSSNSEISEYDITRKLAIGISNATNSIFFLKRRNDQNTITQVDLDSTERCYINQTTRTAKDRSYFSTERVELRFTPSEKNVPETVFELYNIDHDSMSMNGELQLAEKWRSIINSKLTVKK